MLSMYEPRYALRVALKPISHCVNKSHALECVPNKPLLPENFTIRYIARDTRPYRGVSANTRGISGNPGLFAQNSSKGTSTSTPSLIAQSTSNPDVPDNTPAYSLCAPPSVSNRSSPNQLRRNYVVVVIRIPGMRK